MIYLLLSCEQVTPNLISCILNEINFYIFYIIYINLMIIFLIYRQIMSHSTDLSYGEIILHYHMIQSLYTVLCVRIYNLVYHSLILR